MFLPALLGLLTAVSPGSADLVANEDFETLTEDGQAPAQWSYIDADNGDGMLEVGEGVEGGRCAKVVCTRAEGIWGPGIGQTGVVEITGGQWYELTFRARVEGITTGIIAALRNTDDWGANHLWQHFHPTSEWREYQASFKAPYDLSQDVSRLQFSFDSVGTLWLDRVSLHETAAPKSPNVTYLGSVKNRVPNSSFEVGTYGWGTDGTTFLVGEIDRTTAHHGTCSFRLDLDPAKLPIHWNDFTYAQKGRPTHAPPSVSLVTAGYVPVTPGEPMVLSAWVKADQAGGKVRLGLIEDIGADRSSSAAVGTEWARLVVPVQPQAETAFVRIALEPGEGATPPTTLWVDAVQLEAGEQPSDYAPALPVEVGFETERVGNLYHVGESAPLRVAVFNAAPEATTLELQLRVEGFLRETVAVSSLPISAPPGAVTPVVVALPSLLPGDRAARVEDPGFYRLHASWGTAAGPQERRMRFGVIHPLREMYQGQDTFLGQNHSFVTDQLMRLTQDAGTSWVRSWFVRWDNIEPEQGRFDFTEADAQLDRLERLGFNVQLCFGDPTSEWASTAPAAMSESTGAEAESRRVWWLPREMGLFEGYAAALMERYGKRVKYWEVLNEPVDGKGGEGCNLDMAHNYLRFVEAAKRAAARTGTDAQIMGAGLGYLKGMDDVGPVLSAIDILSEHRYPGLQPAAGFQDGFRSSLDTMQAKKAVRPMWMTEYGLYADDDPDPTTLTSQFMQHAGEDSEMLAAAATVRHQVVALANGVEKVFFHIGNWPIMLNREHGCGFHPFFEWGGLPRKMLVAQNALCWALPPGTRFVRALSDEPPVMLYEFANGEGSVFIGWSDKPVELDAEAQATLTEAGARAYNVVGQPQERLTELGEWPVYVMVRPAGAEAARGVLALLAG